MIAGIPQQQTKHKIMDSVDIGSDLQYPVPVLQ